MFVRHKYNGDFDQWEVIIYRVVGDGIREFLSPALVWSVEPIAFITFSATSEDERQYFSVIERDLGHKFKPVAKDTSDRDKHFDDLRAFFLSSVKKNG